MKKSTRHSKITGDFAEAFVLYWLSKHGYECARVDHTGIDLIARTPGSTEVMGVSVKCRSRYDGTENTSINLPPDGFEKARLACAAFGCSPYYAIMVDESQRLRCYLVSLDHLLTLVGGEPDKVRSWQMSKRWLEIYSRDPLIKGFELETIACSWRDADGTASA